MPHHQHAVSSALVDSLPTGMVMFKAPSILLRWSCCIAQHQCQQFRAGPFQGHCADSTDNPVIKLNCQL